jgi:hypothetical protein
MFAWVAYTVGKGGPLLLPQLAQNLTPDSASPAVGGAWLELIAAPGPGKSLNLHMLAGASTSGNHTYELRWVGTSAIIASVSATPSAALPTTFGRGHFLTGPVNTALEASAVSGGGANAIVRAYSTAR